MSKYNLTYNKPVNDSTSHDFETVWDALDHYKESYTAHSNKLSAVFTYKQKNRKYKISNPIDMQKVTESLVVVSIGGKCRACG